MDKHIFLMSWGKGLFMIAYYFLLTLLGALPIGEWPFRIVAWPTYIIPWLWLATLVQLMFVYILSVVVAAGVNRTLRSTKP